MKYIVFLETEGGLEAKPRAAGQILSSLAKLHLLVTIFV